MESTTNCFSTVSAQAVFNVIIAVLGLLIAYRQLVVSRNKIRLDLYDRRYRIFTETRLFLSRLITEGLEESVAPEVLQSFRFAIVEARFLFKDNVVATLKAIDKKALQAHLGCMRKQSGEPREVWINDQLEVFDWFGNTAADLSDTFAPYLRFDRI